MFNNLGALKESDKKINRAPKGVSVAKANYMDRFKIQSEGARLLAELEDKPELDQLPF